MSIIKINHQTKFAMIPNETLADKRLSWKARGILAYLLSLPYDWEVYTSEVAKHSTDGVKSLNSGIQELIKFGYIERVIIRGEKGLYKGYEYSVSSTPTETP